MQKEFFRFALSRIFHNEDSQQSHQAMEDEDVMVDEGLSDLLGLEQAASFLFSPSKKKDASEREPPIGRAQPVQSLQSSASSHDMYTRLSQPKCVSTIKEQYRCIFPESTSKLKDTSWEPLMRYLFFVRTVDCVDDILPIGPNTADDRFYEEFITDLEDKGSVAEIYEDQSVWSSLTDKQFGFVSKVNSVAEDGLEVRVDDMVGFLLESLKFTSPPRPMKTYYVRGKTLKEIFDHEKVAYEAAREVYRQGKVTVENFPMSSTPDLAYYIFGEFSELPSIDKTCTFLVENKRPKKETNGTKLGWDRQIYGEMLVIALRNYELVRADTNAIEPPFYPMYAVQFHGTVMKLYYVAFSSEYLSAIKDGFYPHRAEEVLVFDTLCIPMKRAGRDITNLDLNGSHTQREACIDVLLRLKAYSRCLGGYEDKVLFDPPVTVCDHKPIGDNPEDKKQHQFLLSYESFEDEWDEWVAYDDLSAIYKRVVNKYWRQSTKKV